MAFEKIQSLDADKVITIGGRDKKTGKVNPTNAEGYYLGNRVVGGGKFGGDSTIFFFQTDEGNLGVWGKTDLKRKMGSVPPGSMTRITYGGTKSTPNGDMHVYIVEVDKANTIDVSQLNSASDSSFEDNDDDNSAYDDSPSEDEEDAAQQAALAAAERKAKTAALLNKGRNKVS